MFTTFQLCSCLSSKSKLGSALSGAAQNINWLIACRAVQGLGGGGIIQIVIIVISDIVPLQE
jgi:MFS family permease